MPLHISLMIIIVGRFCFHVMQSSPNKAIMKDVQMVDLDICAMFMKHSLLKRNGM